MISFDLLDEGFLNNVTQNGDLRGNWIVSPPAQTFLSEMRFSRTLMFEPEIFCY